VLRVSQLADGHTVSLIDAVHALMTITDIEHLAKNTGQSIGNLTTERLTARRRILEAITENV